MPEITFVDAPAAVAKPNEYTPFVEQLIEQGEGRAAVVTLSDASTKMVKRGEGEVEVYPAAEATIRAIQKAALPLGKTVRRLSIVERKDGKDVKLDVTIRLANPRAPRGSSAATESE